MLIKSWIHVNDASKIRFDKKFREKKYMKMKYYIRVTRVMVSVENLFLQTVEYTEDSLLAELQLVGICFDETWQQNVEVIDHDNTYSSPVPLLVSCRETSFYPRLRRILIDFLDWTHYWIIINPCQVALQPLVRPVSY